MRLIAVCWLLFVLFSGYGCRDQTVEEAAAQMTGGSPAKGKIAIAHYGCGSCHVIPGVAGAKAMVGPPLAQIADRIYIGGVVTNTPSNMVQWLQHPRSIDPKTAMPDVGLKEQEARDIASYLYTLQ